jgi:methionine biosynthesis protein MetW
LKKLRVDEFRSRVGYQQILGEITAGSRVLDLGCGDGMLLDVLRRLKNAETFGVEISQEGVSKCLEKGLYCFQGDIDSGLADYRADSFDYVILNQTLQDTKKPEYVLRETMRIGKRAIVSFPNFGHIGIRLKLLAGGTMPRNRLFPYMWYETPNIHLLTIRDFQEFCLMYGYPVGKESHFSMRHERPVTVRAFANFRAEYGFFVLDGDRFKELRDGNA